MFFEYDNDLWVNIQDDLLTGINREAPGNVMEIISHATGYEIHYQDTFGNLCEYNIPKSEVFCNYLSYENLVDILFIFTCLTKEQIRGNKYEFGKSCIKLFIGNTTHTVDYKDVERRFIKKLENQKKLKLNIIIEEEKMEPYVVNYNNQAMCCDSYTSYSAPITDNKQTIYQNKKVNIKYQLLIKDLLHIDTKFINRFYKDVNKGCINLYNYENDKAFTLTSFIDGVDRKYHTTVRDEEEAIAYEYVISNSKEFIEWVNQLKTYSLEDYVNVNKVSPNYNLRDVVYYVSRPATIDDRIFNEIWDVLTPEQKTNYLIKNVENQKLICKGTITNLKVGLVEKGSLCSYDNTIYYTIYDFNTGREVVIEEKHIFNNTDDAVSYLVNDCIEKNKKD